MSFVGGLRNILNSDIGKRADVTLASCNIIPVIGSSSSIRLYEDPVNGSNYNELVASTSLAANIIMTLPSVQSSTDSSILVADSSGVMSYVSKIVDDGLDNVGLGLNIYDSLVNGFRNIAIGRHCLENLTGAAENIAIGYNAMVSTTTASSCIAIGLSALASATISNNFNVAIGSHSMEILDDPGAIQNTAVGYNTLPNLLTGANNCCLGQNAGNSYIGGESNNICIKSDGVVGDNNIIRIGNSAHTNNIVQGAQWINQPTPGVLADTTNNVTDTLVKTKIITSAPTAPRSNQLDTVATFVSANPQALNNNAIDFSWLNIGSATSTITTNTGWTLVGNMTVVANAAATFRLRFTDVLNNLATLYRINVL